MASHIDCCDALFNLKPSFPYVIKLSPRSCFTNKYHKNSVLFIALAYIQ